MPRLATSIGAMKAMHPTLRIKHNPLEERQLFLIDASVRWLRQALAIIEKVDDGTYRSSPAGFSPHRMGGHLRHVIEFYDCFLNGLDSFHIDYDARVRDLEIETSRAAAVSKINDLINRLHRTPELRGDGCVWVRLEDAEGQRVPEPFLLSTVGRELQVLSSHTIHHFALIGLTLKLHGVEVPEEFGMAPSTMRHTARAGSNSAVVAA